MSEIYDKIETDSKLELHNGYTDRLTACKFLVASALKTPFLTIGIGSPKNLQGKEIIQLIREIIEEYPLDGIDRIFKVNNKLSIELFNGSKFIFNVVNGNAFRGYSTSYIFVDEYDVIKKKDLTEFLECTLPVLHSRKDGLLIKGLMYE